MEQPRDLEGFDEAAPGARRWRVVHLSDVHVVPEHFGFRIESGRVGPRGNGRFEALLARLAAIHADEPLDLLMITGDMTDAGRPGEWIVFLEALNRYPELAAITCILPGNHDVNIVDRANPARLDMPWSYSKRLRQMRTLSAMDAVLGHRGRVVDRATGGTGTSLTQALAPDRETIRTFADTGSIRLAVSLSRVWERSFPVVIEPDAPDGLGVILLNSNAETHFSFTNALGMLPAVDMQAMLRAMAAWPRARWIIALHHHLVEYPKPAKALSERIGTALINGSWVARLLRPMARRILVMHGHRHVDWIGACGELRIISAPSPVMEVTNDKPTSFLIHTLAAAPDGGLALLAPQRIVLPGDPPDPPGL